MKFSIQTNKDDLCLESLGKMILRNFIWLSGHTADVLTGDI